MGVLLLLLRPAPAPAQTWEALESQGAVIARVDIVVSDVFDVSQPGEDNWMSRLANAAHVETRRRVLERELLFRVGDGVDAQRIRETERNLRRQEFVRDARIVPVEIAGISAAARVEVYDAWSLLGNVDVSRSGGNFRWSARLDEVNLLGAGKRVFVEHEENVERSFNEFGYVDPQFLGSRWVLSGSYGDLSDGSSRGLRLERPFFSIDTPYAVGGFVTTSEYLVTDYDRGSAVNVVPIRRSSASLFASRAYRIAGRTAYRVGVSYRADENEYDAPVRLDGLVLPAPDTSVRRVRGLSASWSMVQDRSATFQNFARIGRTEDYNLGWIVSASAGYYAKGLGSVTSAPFGSVSVRKGWSPGVESLMIAEARYGGRHEPDGWRDAAGGAALTAYRRASGGQTFAAQVSAVSLTRPDTNGWLYLGGRDGLRGYVDHFVAGDRRVTASVEDRIITPWRPLGVLQAGFVAYADAGVIRRADTGAWSRVYANIGAGLRFGMLKSGRGTLLLASVAMPLVREPGMDRILVVLGNAVGF